MDPLSITTGVITILQATTAILTICYNYRAALKEAPWSLTRTINELKSLRDVLERLEDLLSRGETRGSDSKIFTLLAKPGEGPFAICTRELEYVASMIHRFGSSAPPGSKRNAALKALRWGMNDKVADDCLQRIERCKSTLLLAMNTDQTSLILEVKDSIDMMKATQQNFDYKVTILDDRQMARESTDLKRQIIDWLSTADIRESHETATSAHYEGTCSWVFETDDFQRWRQGEVSLLWLNGLPGAGKTILFSAIVEQTLQQMHELREDIGFAYFYCDFARSESRASLNVAGSLVAQLCAQYSCPESLIQAYRETMSSPGRGRPTWKTLEDCLLHFGKSRRILLLIDALDECDERNNILTLLSELCKGDNQISVLLSSRIETDIEAVLRGFSNLRLGAHQDEVNKDISSYIQHRLTRDKGLTKFSSEVQHEIMEALNAKSAGMFRWAQCQLDTLSQLRNVRSVRQSLSRLPKGLNETYANILRRCPKDDFEILRRTLVWIAFTVMPLTLAELAEAVAIESDMKTLEEVQECRSADPTDILTIAGSLLTITDSGHVQLAHLTVKEYLLSSELLQAPEISPFGLKIDSANEELTVNCLTYLSLDSLAAGPVETQNDWDWRMNQHPLIRNIAKAWPYYVRGAKKSPDLVEAVYHFFSSKSHQKFLSWIQVLNSQWIFKWDKYPRHATPLYYAASFGLEHVVARLIGDGMDINAPGSRFGGTPLHGATLREHIPIMKMLLAAGANASQADFNEIAPLHTAARIGNSEIISLLLEHGASPAARDSLGKTPCDWAAECGHPVSQKLLLGKEIEMGIESPKRKDSLVYERPAASFPALAVAQGLELPSMMLKL